MKKLLIMLAVLLLAPSAMAQEREVCLVYFTGYGCGDDCGLTDTFMDGLTSEYAENLTAITYYVDANQEAANIFGAYRAAYGLPPDIPIVLFGKDDYLQGITDIYNHTEKKIFSFLIMNGTNCPLEVGYVPPSQLGGQSLPGSPAIAGKWGSGDSGRENGDAGDTPAESEDGEGGLQLPFDLLLIKESEKESLIAMGVILAAVLLVIITLFLLWRKSFMEAE
jgi:hypothetical protein